MQLFEKVLLDLPEYIELENAVNAGGYPISVNGLSAVHKAHFIHTASFRTNKPALVIAADEGEASRLCEDIAAFGGKALYYPARDFNFQDIAGRSREFEHDRILVLSKMLFGEYTAVVCCADGLMQLTVPPDGLKKHLQRFSSGQTVSIEEAVSTLSAAGYERAEQVEGQGQFSLRGGILDFFAPDAEKPVRIEFWGDEIDTVAEFDIISQRRTESVDLVELMPANEVFTADLLMLAQRLEELALTLKGKGLKAKEKLLEEAERLREGLRPASFDKYISLLYERPATLFDYHKGLLFVSGHMSVKERVRMTEWQMGEDTKALLEEGVLCKGLTRFLLEAEELYTRFARSAIFVDSFAQSFDEQYRPKLLINVTALQHPVWMGQIDILVEDINAMLQRGMCVCVMAGSNRSADFLNDTLRERGIPSDRTEDERRLILGKVFVTSGALSAGFEYAQTYFGLITAGRVTGGAGVQNVGSGVKKKRSKPKGKAIYSISELAVGEHVVHSNYGIGVFEGVQSIKTQSKGKEIIREYIKIKYAKSDVVYVPVTQMDLITKYIGPRDNANIRLSSLNSADWQKAKTRVRASVKDIADKLTALYAERMKRRGHAFKPDQEWQRDFELNFEYVETDDQLRCIEEIKHDMENEVPMERLLCGDVGFGKTEVALRAAFKCVSESKQVAILVPTTLLARQHYQTTLRRMEGFPVNVDILTRYTVGKQKTALLKRLKTGETDILIGTHSIIQQSVEFRELGLVVIDEEQRFGVEQKEALKEKLPDVDILILSATPIPRTLNMALSGIRDMSVLEEAPQNRHPVQSYVMEYDEGIAAEAIKKELRRGGQVYYLHNNVETIDITAAKLAALVPNAKIAVAHGKMREEQVGEIWRRLLDNEINVLVCTTIIETGVDVPNVNTLIIDNAHRFGLSQLHQLRGRVGRSARRAYAYFTFPRNMVLTEISTKRLNAVREFTEFGSGFKIAMRDLELRGAGSLFGAQQHGHMEAVGYELFLSMLEEAMRESKGETFECTELDCLLDIQLPAFIPEEYVSSLKQRLDVYRRISAIRTEEDAADMVDELIDRYGEPPAQVLTLIDIARVRAKAARLGIYEIKQARGELLFSMVTFNIEAFNRLIAAYKGRKIKLLQGEKPCIAVPIEAGEQELDLVAQVVETLSV
ncbi:MAG: transcription-repair coupling factor [Oscillospiraceae bacterium]|jgi:transcription-repair coupling factor (superfamily II helicase)|nr:transcription-repair coupling factor [Oscillospiraceae bacterium]